MALSLKEAQRILERGSTHSAAIVEEAKEVVSNFTKKRGSSVMKTEKRKDINRGGLLKMAYGGSVKGKRHMYVGGGSVNAGLLALKKSGPKGLKAFNNITKGEN